ncbi:MAG: hypothetical protein LUG93_02225 [Lachnospiraceae bacterium]|nr:hypothetical protein [Lachnospiraceae bacterium]
MKKYAGFLTGRMLRPVAYKVVEILTVGILLAALWGRYFNTMGLIVTRTWIFPIYGILLLILAWFRFLQLDHAREFLVFENKKKNTSQNTVSVADVLETPPEDAGELEKDEKVFCSMAALIVSGILCLIYGLA